MRLARPGDEKAINAIINHPSVRSLIFTGEGELDVTGCLSDQMFLFDESGVFMVESLGDGEYIAMSAFLPEARGLKAVISHRRAMDLLFFGIGAHRAFATVDPKNLPAVRNLEGLGFNINRDNRRVIAHIDYLEWSQKSKECYRNGQDIAKYLLGNCYPDPIAKALGAFKMSVLGGWPGLALRMWAKYSLLNQLDPIMAMHETENIFSYGDKRFEITHNGFVGG